MTQEDKELLLKDLCARLPYGVIVSIPYNDKKFNAKLINISGIFTEDVQIICENTLLYPSVLEHIQPYLRPMSSMTVDEEYEFNCQCPKWSDKADFCNAHHFDYRGLIEKGLALEAPDGMYTT